MARFAREHPGVEVRLREQNVSGAFEQLVHAGTLDLAVIRMPRSRDGLEATPLVREPMMALLPRVPAGAEFVVEGRLLAGTREPEGPFGEFPQYYGPRAERHVIAVDAVTHRHEPIFHTIVGGGGEHLLLGAVPREASFLSHLRRSFPSVRDLHLSRGGTCRYHLAVQIAKGSEGEARNVILGALAVHYDVKHVVVVDTDVDVHDPAEVEWAVATRFQADRDLVVIPGAQGSKLDPSTDGGVGAKMGLDATVPLAAEPMRPHRAAQAPAREPATRTHRRRRRPGRPPRRGPLATVTSAPSGNGSSASAHSGIGPAATASSRLVGPVRGPGPW